MRTVEEIKAIIARYVAECEYTYSVDDIIKEFAKQKFGSYVSFTANAVINACKKELNELAVYYLKAAYSIPLDRLEEICTAEREGRCVVLPSRNDEIIYAIQVALGIKLYDWQKAYIFGASDYIMPGRQTGRTTAHILKLLLEAEEEPLRLYDRKEIEQACDEYHGSRYYDWFRSLLREIYYSLSNPDFKLKLRKVYFTREAAEAKLREGEK